MSWGWIRRVAILALVLALNAPPGEAADDTVARQLYESLCAFCHGVEGKGDGVAGKALTPPPPDFTTADFWKTKTAEQLRDAITNGKPGTAMVPFRSTLKPDQIETLVEFLRTFAPQ